MRRLIIALLAATAFLLGTSSAASALRDPFPQCITEPCGPGLPGLPDLPKPGPCNGFGFC